MTLKGAPSGLQYVGATVFVPVDSHGLVVLHTDGERIEPAFAVVKKRLLGVEDDGQCKGQMAVAQVC